MPAPKPASSPAEPEPAQAGTAPAEPAPAGTTEPASQVGRPLDALLITSAATLLVLVAYTVPMGSLDPTFFGLNAGASGRGWIVSAMSVGLAAALLATGAMADAWGRRRLFVLGASLLAVSSVAAAAAPDSLTFVLARLLQGVGGAALTACSLGILGDTFRGAAERTRATALWGASLGAGVAIGPLLSAALTATWSWRGGHLACGVAAALVAVWGQRRLAPAKVLSSQPVDLKGALLLTVGLVALLAGLVEVRGGWLRPTALGPLAVGLATLVAFVRGQRNRSAPLIDLALFRRPDFAAATVGAFAAGLGMIALTAYTAVLLTRALGFDGVTAAIVMLAWSIMSVAAAAGARRLPERFAPRWRMIVSLVGVALGQASLAGLDAHSGLWRVLPGLAFFGAATGLLNATLGRQAVASVPAANAAMGSGANNTARYVGAAFGMTLVAVLLGEHTGPEFRDRWNLSVAITAGFSLLGAAWVYRLRDAGEVAKGPQAARA